MAEHIVAFGRTNTIAPAMVSPRRASSRKSSRILITSGSTRTEARIPSRLRLRAFALIAFRPCGETLTVAFERRFDSCMASIPFVMSFGAAYARCAVMKSFNGLAQSWKVGGGSNVRVGVSVEAGLGTGGESVSVQSLSMGKSDG